MLSKTLFFFEKISFLSVLAVVCFIPFAKGGIEASLVVGLSVFFLGQTLGRKWKLDQIPLVLPLLFYLVAVEISTFSNPDFRVTGQGVLRVLKYLGLYLLVVHTIRTERRFVWLQRLLLVVAFLSCLNGFYQIKTGWDFRHEFSILESQGLRRVSGSFNHPNNFAAFLSTVIFIAFCARETKLWTILKFCFLPFYFFLLFQTGSRMAIILMIVIFIFLVFSVKSLRKRNVFFLTAMLTAWLVYWFYDWRYFDRLIKIVLGDLRLEYWITSFDLIKKHPLFGWGINTFMEVSRQHVNMQRLSVARVYAHNFVIQIIVEIGIIGLGCFLFVLKKFFEYVRNYFALGFQSNFRQTLFGVVVGLLFFLLHALVDNNLQSLQLTTFFWVLVGSVMGVVSAQEESKSEQTPSPWSNLLSNGKTA